MKRPRPYQVDAIGAVFAAWAGGARSPLAVLATGMGKTFIAAHVIRRRLAETGRRAMFVAHREELIRQAVGAIHEATGEPPDVEMGEYRADREPLYRARVVVTSVQTQYSGAGGQGRMTRFRPAEFGTVVLDEAHHYVAPSYRRVLDYYLGNPECRALGITATPDRADRSAMGRIFDAAAFEFGIREGIDGGWLCPIDQNFWPTSIDLSRVSTVGGDLNAGELADVMEQEGPLHQVADPMIRDIVPGRRTLVFTASVIHAESLAEILNRHRPGSARWVCGKTSPDERKQTFEDYAAGRFQFLCNVGVATEGFDDPGVEVVVVARPTKSRSLYTQMIGRGTRPLPGLVDRYDAAEDRRMAIAESAKPACEVADLVGNSGRHKLVSVADVLGGTYDDDVVAAAKAGAAAAGGPVDMTEALEAALAARADARATEAARRVRLKVGADYSKVAVDPFDVFDRVAARPAVRGAGAAGPTDSMVAFLEKFGPRSFDVGKATRAEAGRLIGEIKRRWDAGLCSLAQADVLRKRGLPTDVPKGRAKDWLDRIAGNDWAVPADVRAEANRQEVA